MENFDRGKAKEYLRRLESLSQIVRRRRKSVRATLQWKVVKGS